MQDWRKLDPHEGNPCPVTTSCHAAVCLGYGGDHPHLLVIGGKKADNTVLSDAWMLDLKSGRWREVRIGSGFLKQACVCRACTAIDFTCGCMYYGIQIKDPRVQQARCYHSATAFTHSPGLTEVTLFGGCPEWPVNYSSDADVPQVANTTVLRFGE